MDLRVPIRLILAYSGLPKCYHCQKGVPMFKSRLEHKWLCLMYETKRMTNYIERCLFTEKWSKILTKGIRNHIIVNVFQDSSLTLSKCHGVAKKYRQCTQCNESMSLRLTTLAIECHQYYYLNQKEKETPFIKVEGSPQKIILRG